MPLTHSSLTKRISKYLVDNVKVTIQSSKGGIPAGIVPRLEQIFTNIQHQLKQQHQHRQQAGHWLYKHSSSSPLGEIYKEKRFSVWRGIYRGVSFAVIFQVPALTLFLSTYDASKHGLQRLAKSADISGFHYHHFETHLISGTLAKAAGNLIWAPMNKLQSMATHPTLGPLPLTLQDAYRLGRQICSNDGISGLWSGYTKSFTSLLPYTMLYFATYEQCKHAARWLLSETAQRTDGGGFNDWYQLFSRDSAPPDPNSRSLTPGTYMVCVASAVAISSTICQTAIVVRDSVWPRFQSRVSAAVTSTTISITEPAPSFQAKRTATLAKRLAPITSVPHSFLHPQSLLAVPGSPGSPISPLSPTRSSYPSALTMVASTSSSAYSNFKPHTFVPPQLKTLMSSTSMVASQALSSLPWQPSQHATFATTSLMPFRSSGVHHQHLSLLKSPGKGCPPISPFPASTAFTSPPSSTPAISASVGSGSSNRGIYTRLNTPPKNNLLMTMMRHNRDIKSLKMNATNTAVLTTSATNNNSIKSHQGPGIFRTIARGLGPRILWTVPGVTLTTAGFEMFRNLVARPSA